MSRVKDFLKREAVLCIAFLAAVISCFFVPPDGAYLQYIDLRTLALLYCLMVVVAGLRKAGSFTALAHFLCHRAGNLRLMSAVLVALCFFSSMLITNDVALLTFVPFAVVVLGMAKREKELVWVVVLQAVAANLGSMLTPVGNPQNLYLYSCYGMSGGEFFSATAPVWCLSLLLVLGCCLLMKKEPVRVFLGEKPILLRKLLLFYSALFLLCLLVVFRLIRWPVMLVLVLLLVGIFDRRTLLKADFLLLLTFVCFFIFAGNLARIDAVDRLLRHILTGRELFVGVLCSQVISNVPAALLLSGFTENARALLLGVNIGGLGTPVASLASLIALKLYSHAEGAKTGAFLWRFSLVNFLLLAVLLAFAYVLL